MLYHLGKANVVADALSRVYLVSVAHVEKKRKVFVRELIRPFRCKVEKFTFGLCSYA